QERIERARPGALDVLDIGYRIATGRHRPDHIIEIGRIDVGVDHHDPAARIVARVAAGHQHAGLLGVTRMQLLDRDYDEHADRACLMAPYALDAVEAGALDLVPDHARLHDALGERRVGRRPHRRRHGEDRIVAVIDTTHAHDRLIAHMARVIAGELAERSFRSGLVRQEFALDSNLGARRDRQAMELAGDGLVGPAAMAARIRELADSLLDLMAAGKKQHRIEPAADQHRTRLFPLEVFLADHAAVLARRDPYARSIAV